MHQLFALISGKLSSPEKICKKWLKFFRHSSQSPHMHFFTFTGIFLKPSVRGGNFIFGMTTSSTDFCFSSVSSARWWSTPYDNLLWLSRGFLVGEFDADSRLLVVIILFRVLGWMLKGIGSLGSLNFLGLMEKFRLLKLESLWMGVPLKSSLFGLSYISINK